MKNLTIIRPNSIIFSEIYHVFLKCSDETDYLSCDSRERIESGFTLDRFSKFLTSIPETNNELFICLHKNNVIGMLGIHAETKSRFSHRASIGMNVLKKYWNLGAGSLLLDSAIDYFYSNSSLSKLELEVRTDNHRAIKLYDKKGFIKEATIKNHFLIGTTYYSVDKMCILK